MFIVISGEGFVEKDDVEVARCKKGDYFGERALLKNERRAATVTPSSILPHFFLSLAEVWWQAIFR